MPILYLDPENGNNSNDGTTFANRVKGINNGITADRTAPGDTIRMMATRTGIVSGCSITKGTTTLSLPAGNHKIINNCDSTTGWVSGSPFITVDATVSSYVEGTAAIQLTPAASFTTGVICYYDYGSQLDLSAFSAIHCYLECGNATQIITLKIYSDANRSNLVNTLTYDGKINYYGYHSALFLNGAQLSSIARVFEFSISADPGTTVLRIDALAACHDPAVTPNSINPWTIFSTESSIENIFSTAYDCSFQGIRHFLTDTTATLLGSGTSGIQSTVVWPHTTLTSGTLYCWHGVQNDVLASGTNTVTTIQEAGTSTDITVYEGGYNRIDMTTQDTNGLTVLVNSNFAGCCLASKSYTEMRRIIFVGQSSQGASNTAAPYFTLKECGIICAYFPPNCMAYYAAADCLFERICIAGTGGQGGTVLGGERSILRTIKSTNTYLYVNVSQALQIEDLWMRYSPNYALTIQSGTGGSLNGYHIRKANFANSTSADFQVNTRGSFASVYDITSTSSNLVYISAGGSIRLQNINGDINAVAGYSILHNYTRTTSITDGTASSSMKINVISTTANSRFPIYIDGPYYNHTSSINGKLVTVSMRLKKSHETNIVGKMKIRHGIILTEDVSVDIPSDTNWNTVSAIFTPNADGPIEVFFELWATTTTDSVYINPESLLVSVV